MTVLSLLRRNRRSGGGARGEVHAAVRGVDEEEVRGGGNGRGSGCGRERTLWRLCVVPNVVVLMVRKLVVVVWSGWQNSGAGRSRCRF